METDSVIEQYAAAWGRGDPQAAFEWYAEERLDLRRVNVYTVREDKIVDIDIFEANQYEVDAFFGAPDL